VTTKLHLALRFIVGILGCVFGFLLLPQILLLMQLTAYSITEIQLPLQQGIPIVDWPLFQPGGLPSASLWPVKQVLCHWLRSSQKECLSQKCRTRRGKCRQGRD